MPGFTSNWAASLRLQSFMSLISSSKPWGCLENISSSLYLKKSTLLFFVVYGYEQNSLSWAFRISWIRVTDPRPEKWSQSTGNVSWFSSLQLFHPRRQISMLPSASLISSWKETPQHHWCSNRSVDASLPFREILGLTYTFVYYSALPKISHQVNLKYRSLQVLL